MPNHLRHPSWVSSFYYPTFLLLLNALPSLETSSNSVILDAVENVVSHAVRVPHTAAGRLGLSLRQAFVESSGVVGSTVADNVAAVGGLNTSIKRDVCFMAKATPTQLPLEMDECRDLVKAGLDEPHPDRYKTTPELLESYGYPYKEYKVTTGDSYTVLLYRITGSPKIPNQTHLREPVFVNHAILLADAGYDVWLHNARGTTYSHEHESCKMLEDLCYWDYSFEELGLYEVPAVTDLILNETQHKKLFYVGFSMGTTQFFISLSQIPEMNDKVIAAFLMAPVAYMGHSTNMLRHLGLLAETPEAYVPANIAAQGRVESSSQLRKLLRLAPSDMCALTAFKCGVCDNIWFAVFGFNAHQMNYSQLSNIYSRLNSQSFRSIVHYGQLMSTCKFQRFSYNPRNNAIKYKAVVAPEYDLANVAVPLHLYHGEQDNFAVPLDVNITISHLKPGVLKGAHKVDDIYFNHGDFLIAKDADKLVYNKIVDEMLLYSENTER